MITIKENNLNLCALSNWDIKGRTVVQLEYTDANVPVYNKIFDNGTEIVLYPEEGKERVAYGVFYNTDPNNSNSKYIYVDTFESVAMAAKYVNDVLLDKLGLVEKLPIKENKTNEIYDDLYNYADRYRFTTRWTKNTVENYLTKIKRMYALSDKEFTNVINKVNKDFKRKNKVKSEPYAETSYKTEKLNIREKQLNKGRYWVTDDNYIPLSNQPDNGYTKMQAIQRAQREAEQTVKLLGKRFGVTIQDTVKDYHIMDSDGNICHDLDNDI